MKSCALIVAQCSTITYSREQAELAKEDEAFRKELAANPPVILDGFTGKPQGSCDFANELLLVRPVQRNDRNGDGYHGSHQGAKRNHKAEHLIRRHVPSPCSEADFQAAHELTS